MSLLDAVMAAGPVPPDTVPQHQKKRYSEILSGRLAAEVAEDLRAVVFSNVRPTREGHGERALQGGLGPKKVDVTYADEQHGLLLAVSIKTINFVPYGRNLRNRFADLCTEAITLHMRFPYSVVCALFACPVAADEDVTESRTVSTFLRAAKLLGTISGREDYTGPGEKFENVTMMLFQPVFTDGPKPWVKLHDPKTLREITEKDYFAMLRDTYDKRNPHAAIGDEDEADGEE